MMCRHCSKGKVNRPRGLCWSCYYTPGILKLYPSTSKHAYKVDVDFNGIVAIDEQPTDALPGTSKKIEIMAERAKMGKSIFHPNDAPIDEI